MSGVAGMGPGMGRESCKEATVMSQHWLVEWVSMEEGTYVICSGLCTNFKQTGFTFSKQAGKHSIWEGKELIKEEVRVCGSLCCPSCPSSSPRVLIAGVTPTWSQQMISAGERGNPLNSPPRCLGENGFLGESWHSALASLCNPGSHRLEANCNSSVSSLCWLWRQRVRLKAVPPSPRAILSLCLAELMITGLVGEGRGETLPACLQGCA